MRSSIFLIVQQRHVENIIDSNSEKISLMLIQEDFPFRLGKYINEPNSSWKCKNYSIIHTAKQIQAWQGREITWPPDLVTWSHCNALWSEGLLKSTKSLKSRIDIMDVTIDNIYRNECWRMQSLCNYLLIIRELRS